MWLPKKLKFHKWLTYLNAGSAASILSAYGSQIFLKCQSSHVTLLCDSFRWSPLLQDKVQIL